MNLSKLNYENKIDSIICHKMSHRYVNCVVKCGMRTDWFHKIYQHFEVNHNLIPKTVSESMGFLLSYFLTSNKYLSIKYSFFCNLVVLNKFRSAGSYIVNFKTN